MRTIAEGLGSLENVLPDERGGLLVSASDQKAIVRLAPDGSSTVLVPDVTSPGGLRIRDGVLYFNTGDSAASGAFGTADGTIDTYDLGTGARATFARDLVMPNGLAALPNGDFVTSRDIGSGTGITRVPFDDPAHPQFSWVDTSDSNGMAVDPTGTYLYYVETFTNESAVYRVTIASPSMVERVTTLGGTVPPKGLDDMTVDGSGLLYIAANSAGEVIRLDPATKDACVIATGMRNTSAVKLGAGPGWPSTHLFVVGFDGVARELTPPAGQEPVPVGTPIGPPPLLERLTLTARPTRISVGRRTCVRLTVKAQGKRVREATVTFARKVKDTDSRGNAVFCVRPRRAGTLVGRATKGSRPPARVRVRVVS